MAIYTLLADEIEYDKFIYDNETLIALRKISNNALSDVTKTYTVEESLEYIRANRNTSS